MWSEESDKHIQHSAGQIKPEFQEKDWDKMALLLDKHLPQEKKKRSFLFALVLLLGSLPVLCMLTTYRQPPEPEADRLASNLSIDQKELPAGGKTSQHKETFANQETSPNRETSKDRQTSADRGTSTDKKTSQANGNGGPGSNTRNKTLAAAERPASKVNGNRITNPAQTNARRKRDVNYPDKPELINRPLNETGRPAAQTGEPPIPGSNPDGAGIDSSPTTRAATGIVDKTPADTIIKKESAAISEPKKNKQARKKSRAGSFQFSLSFGPDLSSVGVSKTGDWKMQYGFGIGYSPGKHWQIRTGFYTGHKIYAATPGDYHPPDAFWAYYPNLETIKADCLIFEIPLNLVYYFAPDKKHQGFVSAGASSYIMKEESYHYYYKDASGQPQYRNSKVENENKHFFSIIQLSGGYKYRLSNRLSLMAEPYVKIPTSGVGFGKVKLNNAGVLFTIGISPFIKKTN